VSKNSDAVGWAKGPGADHYFEAEARTSLCGYHRRSMVAFDQRAPKLCTDCRIRLHNRGNGPTVLVRSGTKVVERLRPVEVSGG
jgi:hypothetical protein